MGKRIACLACVVLVYGCRPTDYGLVPSYCAHPEAHAIESREQAILAARSIWYCIKPNYQRFDEENWLRNHAADVRTGTWHVWQVLPPGFARGGMEFSIHQSDGALTNLAMTQ
jgi:hypothetical protein